MGKADSVLGIVVDFGVFDGGRVGSIKIDSIVVRIRSYVRKCVGVGIKKSNSLKVVGAGCDVS